MGIVEARIKNFTYENDESPTLHAIDLSIEEGELVVLTGFSGCGKTTLTRILNGLIPYHYGGILDGEVRILGKNILDYKKGELAKYIGNVFQNPSDQFFATIAEEEVAFAGENLGMDFQTLCEKTDAAFQAMQIESLKGAKLSELSGGQKQKVAIASTLIYGTKLLFFDEPSSNLDYEGIVQFQAMIRDLKAMGKTIIIAEHRLFFLNELYDKLIYMKDGTIEKIFLKGELTTEDCRRYGLRAIRYESLVCENPSVPKQAVTHIEDLSVSIGRRELIKNLSFDVHAGEIIAVIGKNGIGKTTLGKALGGLLSCKGQIGYGKRRRQRLRNAYYMMQDVDYQIFFDTVENELIPSSKRKDESYLQQAAEYLRTIDLWEKRLDHPQELSGGQKQRLALATAFLSGRRIIILDEPTSGLDYKRMDEIAKLILHCAQEVPVLIITHDLELLFKVCNTALLLGENAYKKIPVNGNEGEIIGFMGKLSI